MFTKSDADKKTGVGTTTPPSQPYAPTDAAKKVANARYTNRELKAALKMSQRASDAQPKIY